MHTIYAERTSIKNPPKILHWAKLTTDDVFNFFFKNDIPGQVLWAEKVHPSLYQLKESVMSESTEVCLVL